MDIGNGWDGNFAVGCWLGFVRIRFVFSFPFSPFLILVYISLYTPPPPSSPSNNNKPNKPTHIDCKQRRTTTNPPLGPRPPLFSFLSLLGCMVPAFSFNPSATSAAAVS